MLAVLFYDDTLRWYGYPCCDVRYDGQILPRNSVVIGIIDTKKRRTVISRDTYFNASQRKQFAKLLFGEVRETLKNYG